MRFLFPSLRHDRTFLTPCAQHSRRHPTPSERILWEALRARRLGIKFRRQVILGATIVDFFAPEVRLAVEVDGAAHVGREVRDRERDAYLSWYGVRVLRVKAWHVERELHAVLARIRAALGVTAPQARSGPRPWGRR
mgnify:CR=1 FL=1|jgi:very-short-patch-repair endonuclease